METTPKNNWRYLMSFLVGMVVANLLFHTVPEIFEEREISLMMIILFIIFGIVFQYLLHKFLTPVKGLGNQFLTFLHIHNITDGFIIGLAIMVSWEFGLLVALGIMLHDVIHKVIGYQFLRRQGDSRKIAWVKIIYTFGTIIIAGFLTTLLQFSEEVVQAGGALAAGSLTYVSFLLLKEVYLRVTSEGLNPSQEKAFKTLYLVIGAAVMIGLFLIFGHLEIFEYGH
ncbi:MAG: ZIP family metal transporter [Patescibacteria group bacterium]|nr:MAG: ZIP family metal transporter [Patescibacteria group bacterium]